MAKAKYDDETIAYGFGILSIIFGFVSPLAGLVIGIIGFKKSEKIKSKESKKLNKIGIVISAIMLVIAIAATALSTFA